MNDDHFSRLKTLRAELAQIPPGPYPTKTWMSIESWISKATPVIRGDWSSFYEDFQKVSAKPGGAGIIWMNQDFTISEGEHRRLWKQSNEEAEQIRQNILNFLDGILILAPQSQEKNPSLDKVIFICKRFSIFARQLKTRERNRTPLLVEDEYDLQYLLLALLRLHFEDVRPEVWTPPYAGGSARMDFLLKQERVIVEAKKTRDTLRDRQVGDQLIIDIERYAEYPDYHILVCFVYDPDGLIDNPRGLEQDLSGVREKINAIVLVSH